MIILQINLYQVICNQQYEKDISVNFESEFDSERKWNCTILSKRNNVYELLFKNKTEKYEKDKLIVEYHCDYTVRETKIISKRCFKNKLYNNLYAITTENNGKINNGKFEIETKCSDSLMNIIFERTFNTKREWKSTIMLIRRQLYEVNFKYKNYKRGEYIGERNEYECIYEVNDCKIISSNCTEKIKTKILLIDSVNESLNNTLNVNKQDIKDMTENTIPRILIKLKDEIKNLKPLFKSLLKALAKLG